MQKSIFNFRLAIGLSVIALFCVSIAIYITGNTSIVPLSIRQLASRPATIIENIIIDTTCDELLNYFNARERLQQIPFRLVDKWVRENFGANAKWIDTTFPVRNGKAINFELYGDYARITYHDDEFFSADFPININGQKLTDCLGDPDFYQAYIRYDFVPIDTPADKYLKITLFYEEIELSLQGLQTSHEFEDSHQVHFERFIQWRETTLLSALVEHNIINYGSDSWDDVTWQRYMVKPWESWETIEVIPEETVLMGPVEEIAAMQTAVAASIRTTPNFFTAISPDSPACQAVLNPVILNLHYGKATPGDTLLLLEGLYGFTSFPEEYENQILGWQHHSEIYTAVFQDDILQSLEFYDPYHQIPFEEYITCFGEPKGVIVRSNEDEEGNALYLFFPEQGIVASAYSSEQTPTYFHAQTPATTIYQTSPQTDSIGIIHLAFGDLPYRTLPVQAKEEWIELLQPWQGFEQLVVTEQ